MIARALLKEFPERAGLFSIGELQLDSQIIRNHNGLLGRYPGADGMKTGFTCPAGFNVVASANHYGRHLITVVLGAPSAQTAQPGGGRSVRPRLRHGRRIGVARVPAVGRRRAPDRRSNVCLHRSAAAIAAEEEEGGGEQEVVRVRAAAAAAARGRRRGRRAGPHAAFGRASAVRSRAGVRRPGRGLERPRARPAPHLGRRRASRRRQGLRRRQAGRRSNRRPRLPGRTRRRRSRARCGRRRWKASAAFQTYSAPLRRPKWTAARRKGEERGSQDQARYPTRPRRIRSSRHRNRRQISNLLRS